MFKTMSESVSVGMVVADMNVPGCPLAYINEGFKHITGISARLILHPVQLPFIVELIH